MCDFIPRIANLNRCVVHCRLEKKIAQAEQKVERMKLDMRIKDDLKSVALGTSKINYMDPRISVAWCKRHEVPIEKVRRTPASFLQCIKPHTSLSKNQKEVKDSTTASQPLIFPALRARLFSMVNA